MSRTDWSTGGQRKLLVTGCGRSGTKFAANWLTARGLFCGHESNGWYAVSSWCLGACEREGSRLQPLVMPEWHGVVDWGASYTCVVHLVRDPLNVIASWTHTVTNPHTWDWASKHIPDFLGGELDGPEKPLLRAAQYWLRWNLMCERKADVRIRVETMKATAETVRTNARSHPWVSWPMLERACGRSLTGDIQALARHYGYQP